MTITGILLAAGQGLRFGGDKLLARLPDGTPVAVTACINLHAAVERVVAVVRPGDGELAEALAASGAQVVECEHAAQGMSASLACGVDVASGAHSYVVALADMPWVRSDTIARIAAELASGASLAAPFHRGQRGHPVGFAASHREALLQLRGDEGARTILAAHRDALVRVQVDDPGILRDVDRPEDLASTDRYE